MGVTGVVVPIENEGLIFSISVMCCFEIDVDVELMKVLILIFLTCLPEGL